MNYEMELLLEHDGEPKRNQNHRHIDTCDSRYNIHTCTIMIHVRRRRARANDKGERRWR